MTTMAKYYYSCVTTDMDGRAPGLKCISSLSILNGQFEKWDALPYDRAGGGCGGSMRSQPCGLVYSSEKNREELVRTSIESGRITHNHATGYMGAFWSFDGWAGASGDDSVIIGYDALLGSNGDWEQLVHRGVLHGGDNDSTGCIAATWFGAFYGFPDKKYEKNWKNIEYYDRIAKVANELYNLNQKL
ncbi:hypothetical protein FDP41_006447 [Naegleria fowleri]|uniref:ADP-ribosylhydrolase ARH1 n=1 Tax=Naegleria fowleri TaxID=5763 RepID=A0A6A5BLG1_NAEFO|nr:uncharacterized protein FDP41_006447 [Naegleria fowleri]KAF0974415.1 hypothetical protein FDP41_006447 [Naegleria fowleri]